MAKDAQPASFMSEFKATQLEINAKKHWDLFYKRNTTKFFKDRHWTIREFRELCEKPTATILEVGCGVGNAIYPLLKQQQDHGGKFKFLACDLSPRAIELLKSNPQYDEKQIRAFQCDITSQADVFQHVQAETIDIVTMIFVLSAIHPKKHVETLQILSKALQNDGVVLFRDYAKDDWAQHRFNPKNRIEDNFYMRQDGTRSYFFSLDYIESIFETSGFVLLENNYVERRTINRKEGVDVPRRFIQVKARKIANKEISKCGV